MSRFKIAKRLGRLGKKLATSKGGIRTGIIGSGAAVGSVSGFSRSQPGLRKEGALEGALGGATIGSAIAFSPQIIRFSGRTLKNEGKRAAKIVKRKGKFIFRRIRGRIIPIRRK